MLPDSPVKTAPTLQLRSVEIIQLFPQNGGVGEPLAKVLRPILGDDDDEAVVLSSRTATPFYVSVRIAKAPNDAGDVLHLRAIAKPDSDPPDELIEARDEGRTIEALLAALKGNAHSASMQGLVEAIFVVDGERPPTPIAAAPLHVDGVSLELVGAEFRPASQEKAAVQLFAWSPLENGSGFRCRFRYVGNVKWTKPGLWVSVTRRCLHVFQSLT